MKREEAEEAGCKGQEAPESIDGNFFENCNSGLQSLEWYLLDGKLKDPKTSGR